LADDNDVVHRLEQNVRPAVLTPEAMLELKTEVDEMTQRLKAFATLEFENRINELSKLNKKRKFRQASKTSFARIKKGINATIVNGEKKDKWSSRCFQRYQKSNILLFPFKSSKISSPSLKLSQCR